MTPRQKQSLRHPRTQERRGAMVVLVVIMLIVFFVAVAFTVDVAYMHLVRGELRTATDAATKAAAESLSRTQDTNQAIARGREIARENLVAGKGLELDVSDFRFGNSKQQSDDRFVFQENKTPVNSIQVNARRTVGSRSGSVGLFFGRMLGRSFFEPTERATATFVERDLVVVVDRSGSMLGQKFIDLQRAMVTFVSVIRAAKLDTRVGLASYSSNATEDVVLTSNLDLITRAMSRMPVAGSTSISRGMSAGEKIMKRARTGQIVERSMIVLTDGLHNTGPLPEPVAESIAADDIVIHTICFGSDADITRMQNIATIGKGQFFQADNGVELDNVFRELALTLSTVITE
jgi:Ca-activated chloride channel homolog